MTGDATSPEFSLIAACCRWPPSGERAAAIRASANQVADWGRFLRLIEYHRVGVLVFQALRAAATEIPAAVGAQLDAIVQSNAPHGLRLAAETVRLQNLLAAAAIPNLVLKGVALEQLAYGSIAAKQSRDIDLLVPPECAERALRLIERDGYTLSLPAKTLSTIQRRALIRYAREVEFTHPRTQMRVELQWRAADNPVLLFGIDAHSVAQIVALSEDTAVRTLAPDDLFAYLCVHGARHRWSRMKWLADLNALVMAKNAVVEQYRHAQSVGAGLCAGQALLLCRDLFALELPGALARDLEASNKCRRLVGVARAALVDPEAATERNTGIGAVANGLHNQWLLGRGWAFYAAQWRLAFAGVADIVRVPLPRPLHFIYPLLRLPLWLWRRAKLAFAPR